MGGLVSFRVELTQEDQALAGFGYRAVAVKTRRQELLKLIEQGLRKKKLPLPSPNGPVQWLAGMEASLDVTRPSQIGSGFRSTSGRSERTCSQPQNWS